ncbi:MAG: hypothetical protein ACSHX4_06615 [Opitutaceae bacterium]
MSDPIWPVVTENLAEQLSASQGGVVHPTQLLPYLPVSIGLIEQTLDELAESDRVQKETQNGLTTYLFVESLNKPAQKFAPRHCVYSNEPLDDFEYTVLSPETRQKIETELAHTAEHDIWPAEAVWQHELIYLANNLPAPASTSDIAGHSRISFKKVEKRLTELKDHGILNYSMEINAWTLPPLRYPTPVYKRNDLFIRQFPGALQEEVEVRLLKGLSMSLLILIFCFLLAVTARIPFPLVFFGGLAVAAISFFRILKAPPKPLPSV